MPIIPISYNNIDWKNSVRESSNLRPEFEGKRFLYRGNSQGKFEMHVLLSMLEDDKPSYFGLNDIEYGKITFCSILYDDPFHYAKDWVEKFSPHNRIPPFSNFPITMEINAENYKDKLCVSTEGEGGIIRGPVDMNDITVLYSLHIDRTEERSPFNDELTRNVLNGKTELEASFGTESPFGKPDIDREDLLDRYEKECDVILKKLYSFTCMSKPGTKEERMRLLKDYLNVLRGKLRA